MDDLKWYEIMRLRQMYSETDSFVRNLLEAESRFDKKKAEGNTGLRRNGLPSITTLPDYLRERFNPGDINLFKQFEAYLLSTYPPYQPSFNMSKHRLSCLFPQDWFERTSIQHRRGFEECERFLETDKD